MLKLSTEEKALVVYALQIRRNIIETGDPCLSAIDAARREMAARALSESQMKLILFTDALIDKVIKDG